MRMKIAAGAMSLCCVLASQAETVLSWSAADTGTSYADGAVTVTRDEANKVVKLSVDPDAAGGLRFTGETITFADAGGEIAVASYGDLAFETALSCAGKLSFTTTVEVYRDVDVTAMASAKGVLLTNAQLSDWDVWFATRSTGGVMSGYHRAYCALRYTSSCYSSFQYCSKNQTRGYVAVFEQSGDNVTLRYYGGAGCDIQKNIRGYNSLDYESEWTKNWNYYPTSMRMIRRSGFVTVSLRSAVSATALDVGHGLAVYADGDQALVGSGGTFAVPVNIEDGHFGFRGRTVPVTLKMAVTGHNCELDFIASEEEKILAEGSASTLYTFESGENATTNCTINISGSAAREQIVKLTGLRILPGFVVGNRDNDDQLPTLGHVEIGNRGRLILQARGAANGRGHNSNTEINVNAGGVLEDEWYWQLDCRQTIFLYGGTIFYGRNDTDYLGNCFLRDGARVECDLTGAGFTFGAADNTDVGWTVSDVGSQPSTLDSNLKVLGNGYASGVRSYDFCVGDVTEDGQVDFLVRGAIVESDVANYNRVILRKLNAGTMRIDGKCLMYYRPIQIEGGTWMLGANDVCDASVNYALMGGCFAVAANTANSVGTISLTTDSMMTVADGASISFADCSAQTWNGLLNVTADLKKSSIRFGTSDAGLTAAQKAQIRVNGRKACFDSQGYLVPSGLAIIVR